MDDASDTGQVVTNYQNLISKDKVDLVLGPFSTLLSVPAATVANRYHYAFVEPAGGGPAMFDAKLPNVFFVQPAPVVGCGQPFVNFILSLPADQRPKTAAYPSLDDPFASPIADAMQAQFEAAGIQTVFKTIYPPETTDLTPIVAKVVAANPDMVVAGTQSEDAYAQVKAMVQQFSPKFLFLANGANSPTEFPRQGGGQATRRASSAAATGSRTRRRTATRRSWPPTRRSTAAPPSTSTRPPPRRIAAGQLIQAVATKTGSIDNQTIISTLHSGTWPTLEGNLSWDQYGSPQGSDMLVEWIDGKLLPVYPADVALHAPVYPKPNWGG